MNNRALIEKFIEFVYDNLGLTKNVKIKLTKVRGDVQTTAYYDIVNHIIVVYCKNRAIVDVMRSLAHEMVHHLQNERGDLCGDEYEGSDGSVFENEANAKAGELIRIFGKQNPEIYN